MHKYVLYDKCTYLYNCSCLPKSVELGAGKMKGIAFLKDPDGYWIEIFDLKTIGNIAVVS